MNIPEGVKEIFSILTMRDTIQFYDRARQVPQDVSLYNQVDRPELFETAADALSRTDKEVIRLTFENNYANKELADLLTKYHNQGRAIIGAFEISYTELLFKLVLPYISPNKLVQTMQYLNPEVREEIVRFAPYGLKADVVELARAENISIPGIEKWDIQDLRRKQQKLDQVSTDWEEQLLSDEEIRVIMAEIDEIVKEATRGAITQGGDRYVQCLRIYKRIFFRWLLQ
ncbi:MAG: hypothetical protein ABH952_05720 [Candidatus Omnitrophota bacterium]